MHPTVNAGDYKHSLVHYAVASGDHAALLRLLSAVPDPPDPSRIRTESESLAAERIYDGISAVLDRRDNPGRDTALHLAVKLDDVFAADRLAASGADISLQNASGWNPLQEAVLRRGGAVAETLLQHQHRAAWVKWRRRLPRVVAGMRRMKDFYMEISFHFESSIVPFVGKIAPSDTYRIWKRDGNLRADTSLAGFDGMKVQRADQSYFFFGDGEPSLSIPSGSLLILNRDEKKIFDAFENAGAPLSDADVAGFCNQTSVHRPGMDVTQAELVGRTNWRRQEKMESVGEWKAKVYEVHNVVFSYRSRKIITGDSDIAGSEQILPLELEEDAEEGFLVAENPRLSLSSDQRRRRHSSFIREERDTIHLSRTSVDGPSFALPPGNHRRRPPLPAAPPPLTKEKEFVKSLKPSVWLTEQFPLKTEEFLPLLDILANKVKAVRRMRELLTTKFPPGTFPVKLAIPVVPTVRVIITFTKFVELPPSEQFFTPFSSPRHLVDDYDIEEEEPDQSHNSRKSSLTSSSVPLITWNRRSSSRLSSANKVMLQQQHYVEAQEPDPFAIPTGYSWSNFGEKSRKMKKSKSTRKR